MVYSRFFRFVTYFSLISFTLKRLKFKTDSRRLRQPVPEGVFGQQELRRGPHRGQVQLSGGSRDQVSFQNVKIPGDQTFWQNFYSDLRKYQELV